jgi:hypothetical protein
MILIEFLLDLLEWLANGGRKPQPIRVKAPRR